MNDLTLLRKHLANMNLASIARGAKINKVTLFDMVKGKTIPKYKTVNAILGYLLRKQDMASRLINENESISLAQLRILFSDVNLKAVSRATGLHSNTLYRIFWGMSKPKKETFQTLVKYLRENFYVY